MVDRRQAGSGQLRRGARAPSAAAGGIPTPASLLPSVNVAAWYTGDMGVTESDAIDEWADQSGNGNDASATLTTRPVVGASLNDIPGLQFDGINDALIVTSFAGIGAGDKPVMYVVADIDSTGADEFPVLAQLTDDDTVNRVLKYFLQDPTTNVYGRSALGAGPTTSTATGTASLFDAEHLHEVRASNASDRCEVWSDGALLATAGAGAAGGIPGAATKFYIGSGIGNIAKCTIWDVLLVDAIPPAGEYAALKSQYYTAKFELTLS